MSENDSGGWGNWFAAAQSHAKEFVGKAQEIAEIASKATQEQASNFAKHAAELRQNYDMEVATSILMSTVGGPVDSSFPGNHTNAKPTKMNFKDLDLVYVTENLMAMAFPFDRPAKAARQALLVVAGIRAGIYRQAADRRTPIHSLIKFGA